MTEITARGEKKLVLAAGRAHPELARDIAKEAHLRIARGHDPAAEKLLLKADPGADTMDAVVEALTA